MDCDSEVCRLMLWLWLPLTLKLPTVLVLAEKRAELAVLSLAEKLLLSEALVLVLATMLMATEVECD